MSILSQVSAVGRCPLIEVPLYIYSGDMISEILQYVIYTYRVLDDREHILLYV